MAELYKATVDLPLPFRNLFGDGALNNGGNNHIDEVKFTYEDVEYVMDIDTYNKHGVTTYYILDDESNVLHNTLNIPKDFFNTVESGVYLTQMASFSVDHPMYVYENGRWTKSHFSGVVGAKVRMWKEGGTSHTRTLYNEHDLVLPEFVV